MIPEDWDCEPLGSFAQVSTGGTPSRSNPLYWNGLIPWITTAEIDYHQIDGTNEYITEKGLSSSAARLLPPGVLLMAMYGQGKTRGKVAITSIEAATNQACAGIRLEQHISSGFIFYWLANQYHKIRILSNTGNQENLNLNLIRSILCPLPPTRNEQNNIFEMLVDIDSSIAAIECLAEKKRQIKHAAMQELLTGKRRLPGFEGEWKEASIGGIIDLLTGFPFPSSGYRSSGVRLLRGSNVKRGLIDWNEDLAQHWPAITSDIAHYELRERDIVIAMDGALVGRSYARVQASDLPALLLQRVARIRSSSLCNDFLFFQIGSSRFADHCDSVKTSTAIPHISPSDIRNFTTLIPLTKKEQKAIAAILLDLDAELSGLKARLDKARELKQGMMQQLLTGKIRLR